MNLYTYINYIWNVYLIITKYLFLKSFLYWKKIVSYLGFVKWALYQVEIFSKISFSQSDSGVSFE